MADKTSSVLCTVKEYRRRKGLSQTELADLVGVRRQAIYDMESGRYLPNTNVALRLAQVLGCTVEMLFVEKSSPATPPVHLLDEHHTGSARLSLALVRDKLVAIPLTASPHAAFPLRAADGLLLPGRRVDCAVSPEQLARTLLILGCDPALAVLQDLIARVAPVFRAHNVFASSRKSLLALNRGHAHIAATHFPGYESGDGNVEAVRALAADMDPLVVAFAAQEEGFMVARGNPLNIKGVDDLLNPAVRFANREEGAALRTLLQCLLHTHNIPTSAVKGFNTLVHSHNEGAVQIVSGAGDVVLGLRVVAEAYGLDFVPLAVTRSDLVIPADLKDEQGVGILLNILQSAALQKELRALPGYDAGVTGKVILKNS